MDLASLRRARTRSVKDCLRGKEKPRASGVLGEGPGFGGRAGRAREGADPRPLNRFVVAWRRRRASPLAAFVKNYTRRTAGSHRARAGNAISRPTSTKSATRKG